MTKDFFGLEKNFDGLDHSKINQDNLIGISVEAPKVDLDINMEDPEGVLSDDFVEVFQAAIKNIINTTNQLKNLPNQEENFKNGGDIFLDLAVNNREAEKGGYIPLEYQRYIICSQCEDKNQVRVLQCPKCEGVGRVVAHRRVEIKVPKNIEPGSVLRVASEGHAPLAGSGQVSGDLFVKIIVREEV